MSAPARFSFLDEGEALRRLGVDRDTLLTFVREKRLRAYPGVGKGNFYRLRDIDALHAELFADAASAAVTDEGEAPPTGRKVFDPAYKVHVRLQADLKWYDLEDEDLQAWVRELHEDGYARQRSNITAVMAKLQRLVDLMDDAAAGWQTLKPNLPTQAAPIQPPATDESGTTQSKPRRKTLPMFTGAQTPQTPPPLQAPPSPPPPSAAPASPPKMRGRNLPMATLPQRPPAPQTEQANQSDESKQGEQSDSTK